MYYMYIITHYVYIYIHTVIKYQKTEERGKTNKTKAKGDIFIGANSRGFLANDN